MSLRPPSNQGGLDAQLHWGTSLCERISSTASVPSRARWVVLPGVDVASAQHVLKVMHGDLDHVMSIHPEHAPGLDAIRPFSIEDYDHPTELSVHFYIDPPPNLSGTIEMYRLAPDITVRRFDAKLRDRSHPQLVIRAPTISLWQEVRRLVLEKR